MAGARTGGPYGRAYLTDCDGGIPATTIKVYEVGRDGLTLIVREEAEVVPLEQP